MVQEARKLPAAAHKGLSLPGPSARPVARVAMATAAATQARLLVVLGGPEAEVGAGLEVVEA
jgi:hypothetical protein